MRYFVPELTPGWINSVLSPTSDHFGGLPIGFPPSRWPKCRRCCGTQSFLVQLAHEEGRLDLGGSGRTLFLFQCNHNPGLCETWDCESGANAALLVEPQDLIGTEPTEPPGDCAREAFLSIAGWVEQDDGVAPEQLAVFFDYDAWLHKTDTFHQRIENGTKLGGAPWWVQAPEVPSGDGWKFVAQLACSHEFKGPAPSADELGCSILYQSAPTFSRAEPRVRHPLAPSQIVVFDTGEWSIDAANYGGDGNAYVFVNLSGTQPEARMLWQCG